MIQTPALRAGPVIFSYVVIMRIVGFPRTNSISRVVRMPKCGSIAEVSVTFLPATVAVAGIESKACGGGQARGVTFGHSLCGDGHDLSPPKFPHCDDAASVGFPSMTRFSQSGPSSAPMNRNCR